MLIFLCQEWQAHVSISIVREWVISLNEPINKGHEHMSYCLERALTSWTHVSEECNITGELIPPMRIRTLTTLYAPQGTMLVPLTTWTKWLWLFFSILYDSNFIFVWAPHRSSMVNHAFSMLVFSKPMLKDMLDFSFNLPMPYILTQIFEASKGVPKSHHTWFCNSWWVSWRLNFHLLHTLELWGKFGLFHIFSFGHTSNHAMFFFPLALPPTMPCLLFWPHHKPFLGMRKVTGSKFWRGSVISACV